MAATVLFGLGIAAAVAMAAIDGFAPCDPNAPIMSFDGSREMPQPYANISLLLNAAAPIFLGMAAGIATEGRGRIVVGLAIWFLTGLAIYFISVAVWKHTCPP